MRGDEWRGVKSYEEHRKRQVKEREMHLSGKRMKTPEHFWRVLKSTAYMSDTADLKSIATKPEMYTLAS